MNALVLAGGVPQKELILKLKQEGYTVILIDGNPNPIAKSFADVFYTGDVFDTPFIESIAKKHDVEFILTVCADQVLLAVAKASENLGLPCYIDYETAQNVSDKIKMKDIFLKNDIPSTRFIQLDEFNEDAVSTLKYPLVVKPVDAYSSRGVRKADNLKELKEFYQEAQKISRTRGVIVEEFFKGEEISVDAFVVKGKVKILAVTNSEKLNTKDRFVISRGRFPAATNQIILDKISEVAQKIADAFGLYNSPLLIQLLHNFEDISILEFSARTGGSLKYLLIKYSSGVDVIQATLDITIGRKPNLEPKEKVYDVVVNDFLYCEKGTLNHFEGFDELKEKGVINEFHPLRPHGFIINGNNSSSDRVAGMNIVATSLEEYNNKREIILKSIKVINNENIDILKREFVTELK